MAPSTRSKDSHKSRSRSRPSAKVQSEAKRAIAVALELIDTQLLKLDAPERIMSLTEVIRRAGRRLETEAKKLNETFIFDTIEPCESEPTRKSSAS